MSIQASLLAYLDALPGMVEVAGNRIYPGARTPGEVLPAITYFTVSHQRIRNLKDWACGHATAVLQLDLWAETYKQAKELEALVRGSKIAPRLDGFAGQMGDHWVACATVTDTRDEYERPEFGEGRGTHRVSMDVTLSYQE